MGFVIQSAMENKILSTENAAVFADDMREIKHFYTGKPNQQKDACMCRRSRGTQVMAFLIRKC